MKSCQICVLFVYLLLQSKFLKLNISSGEMLSTKLALEGNCSSDTAVCRQGEDYHPDKLPICCTNGESGHFVAQRPNEKYVVVIVT